MALDPKNPLSMIGASNDPTLTQRTVDQNKGAIDLQRGLAQIASQGQNADRLAGINNSAAKDAAQALMFQKANINPLARDALTQLARTKNSNIGLVDAQAFGQNAGAWADLAKNIGYTANPQPTGADIVSPTNSATMTTPGAIMAAAAGSNAKVTGTDKNEQEIKRVGIGDKVLPGFSSTTKGTNSVVGEVKGNGQQKQAQQIIDDVQQQLLLRKAAAIPDYAKLGLTSFRYGTNKEGQTILIGEDSSTPRNSYELRNFK